VSHTALDTNKTVIREFYAAMNARDVDACFAHYAPDAQLDVLVAGPFGGRQPASREGLVAFFAAFPRLDFHIEALTAEADRVAAEVTSRGELPEGQAYGNRYHNLFILKDSKIAFFREYPTGIAPN
jgi:ketosteroid isomerase-like protein